MGLEMLHQSGIEVKYTYINNKDHQLDQDKIRILRQTNDHSCVYLIIGYEAKGNDQLFDGGCREIRYS